MEWTCALVSETRRLPRGRVSRLPLAAARCCHVPVPPYRSADLHAPAEACTFVSPAAVPCLGIFVSPRISLGMLFMHRNGSSPCVSKCHHEVHLKRGVGYGMVETALGDPKGSRLSMTTLLVRWAFRVCYSVNKRQRGWLQATLAQCLQRPIRFCMLLAARGPSMHHCSLVMLPSSS